ncbi:MAG TPA: hypothetical protein VM840_04215 [Actinomycetota bacterium]|nr:hypothetical protein [Actinomycetota bacterium]
MDTLRNVARGSVKTWLRAVRLPLSVAERVTGRDGDAGWAPSVVYDAFASQVKGMTGLVLRDDDLMTESRLHQTKVEKVREAKQAEALAEIRRAEADQRMRREKAELEREKAEIAQRAEERTEQLEQQKQRAKASTRTAAAKREQSARQKAEARTKAAQARREAARPAEVEDELRAVRTAEQAVAAKSKVARIDQALEANKARRRSNGS